MITEAEVRWRNQVLPEIQTSPSLQARIQQDPILREALIVLTAGLREDAVAAAERLRSRWFPFHGLNEIGEQRRKWLGDLQEVTASEARERGATEERVKDLVNEQAVWLAVMRSPMKSTAPQVWKQAQKRWIQEYKSDVLTEVNGSARRRHGAQPVGFEPPSPERFFAETRLLHLRHGPHGGSHRRPDGALDRSGRQAQAERDGGPAGGAGVAPGSTAAGPCSHGSAHSHLSHAINNTRHSRKATSARPKYVSIVDSNTAARPAQFQRRDGAGFCYERDWSS